MQQNPDMAELWQLAQSSAGQKFLEALRHNGGKTLQQALAKASEGDYTEAKNALTTLLEDPSLREMLAQLGGNL